MRESMLREKVTSSNGFLGNKALRATSRPLRAKGEGTKLELAAGRR